MWRLLSYRTAAPEANMAIDEAILESHIAGLVPPTLRFYGWLPQAVSIGYAQKVDEETQNRIAAAKFALVRRPTGGRAVLHAGDLTYSFVGTSKAAAGKSQGFLDQSVAKAYRQISQALIQGLLHLGVEANLGGANADYRNHNDCFMATTGADLQVNGSKLVGSAQLRRHEGVLQHGSLLLSQDQNLMAQLFSPESFSRSDETNYQRHVNLYDLIGEKPIPEIEAALVKGFEEVFEQTFLAGALLPFEEAYVASTVSRFALNPAAATLPNNKQLA